MTEPLILSASSITTWLRCHRQYLYSSVYRVQGGQNLAAALGVAVHAAAEAFWKSPTRPQAALRRAFEAEVVNVPVPYEEPLGGLVVDGERMVGVYIAQVAPRFTPTLVEQEFLIDVAEVPGVLLSGTIDAADENDVRDLKTTSMISRFNPSSYSLQLNLYGLGYRALTGRAPRRLLLDVLTRSGNVPYREIEVEADVGGTLDVIGLARDDILNGDYSPTGADAGMCKWCSYREICPSAKVD